MPGSGATHGRPRRPREPSLIPRRSAQGADSAGRATQDLQPAFANLGFTHAGPPAVRLQCVTFCLRIAFILMTVALITRPAERTGARMQVAATWLYVLPLFTDGVANDVFKAEIAGLAVLAFVRIVISDRVLPQRAVERIFMTAGVLTLIGIAYLAFKPWPSDVGTTRSYDTQALIWGANYVAVAVFVVLFFEEELFEQVIWRVATLALWIGVASCAASRLTGHPLLVNSADGGLRMVGTLNEPSAWATVLPLVLLLALRRRSYIYLPLVLAGLVLAASPTCMLIMAATVPLYYAMTSSWRYRILLLVILAIIVPAGVFFVQRADAAAWLDSGNPTKIAVGRLVSGIQNVETDGDEGTNSRFQSTTVVIAAAREHGLMHFGAGPAADVTWLAAMYPEPSGTIVGANTLWAAILFDFGEVGVAAFSAMMIAAVWRMHRNPRMTAIVLPFFIAALVNSTSAGPGTEFIALGIMLFAFRWAPKAAPFRPQGMKVSTTKLRFPGGGQLKPRPSG